jgi:hypothetical protein
MIGEGTFVSRWMLGLDQVYIPDLIIHRVHKTPCDALPPWNLIYNTACKIACINKLGSCIVVTEKPIPFKFRSLARKVNPWKSVSGGVKWAIRGMQLWPYNWFPGSCTLKRREWVLKNAWGTVRLTSACIGSALKKRITTPWRKGWWRPQESTYSRHILRKANSNWLMSLKDVVVGYMWWVVFNSLC